MPKRRQKETALKPKNYISQALLTESTDFESIVNRIDPKTNLDSDSIEGEPPFLRTVAMHAALSEHAAMASLLDDHKRLVFYGKTKNQDKTEESRIPAVVRKRLLEGESDLREKLTSKRNIRMLHAVLGIQTEAGELIEAYLNGAPANEDVDVINVKEEVADILWYIAILCDEFGFSLEDAMTSNIAKLRKRYGEKFSAAKATDRDALAERGALETNAAKTKKRPKA